MSSEGLPTEATIAYFSMEIGLESAIPTYAGGLGVLAGDTLRAAADLGLPMVAVSLLHRQGYFTQRLGPDGSQQESPDPWTPEQILEELPERVTVDIEGKTVFVRAWRYVIRGVLGDEVPVYLLDTRLSENAPEHQALTDHLYGGDRRYRLCQEAVLGMGGRGDARGARAPRYRLLSHERGAFGAASPRAARTPAGQRN